MTMLTFKRALITALFAPGLFGSSGLIASEESSKYSEAFSSFIKTQLIEQGYANEATSLQEIYKNMLVRDIDLNADDVAERIVVFSTGARNDTILIIANSGETYRVIGLTYGEDVMVHFGKRREQYAPITVVAGGAGGRSFSEATFEYSAEDKAYKLIRTTGEIEVTP